MKDKGSRQKDEKDFDTELILTFFSVFNRFERALKKAGFTKPGRNTVPDWERFAKHIEGQFDPEATPELQGAVLYMLGHASRRATREIKSRYPSEVLWLSTSIQETAKDIARRMNFERYSNIEDEVMLASLMILEAWSHCDPKIEEILNDVQSL